jgi:hypothetical protein
MSEKSEIRIRRNTWKATNAATGPAFGFAGGPASMADFRVSPVTLRHRLSTGLL